MRTLERGAWNQSRVMAEILRRPGLSRTDVGNAVGLNVASVSRITRDLIDAGLVQESDEFGPVGRPGRRFVGLVPRPEGGTIVGVGMNAFRQSITLADLGNQKIAEWVSDTAPDRDGQAFMDACVARIRDMVDAHIPDRSRFFGVGMAIAAELDEQAGDITCAPIFGWAQRIPIAKMIRQSLNAPLVIDTPPSAINKAEAERGLGQDMDNLITLHCSLGYGIGVRQLGKDQRTLHEVGRVLNAFRAPDASGLSLSEACGGLSVLRATRGIEETRHLSDTVLSAMLIEEIARAENRHEIGRLLKDTGARAARSFSLVLDLFRPDRIILAGPLAGSPDYVAGFKEALPGALSQPGPDVVCSDMTPTGASRWLALRSIVAMGDLDLTALKMDNVA